MVQFVDAPLLLKERFCMVAPRLGDGSHDNHPINAIEVSLSRGRAISRPGPATPSSPTAQAVDNWMQ